MTTPHFDAFTGLDEDIRQALLHLGFVHIHPFWDGNGRMARLLANIPLLRHGLLPLVIETTRRKATIDTLATYQPVAG
jgi:Fic family protein